LVDNHPFGDTGPRKEESIVPRTRPAYPPEFRRQIVELVRAGRTPEKEELAQLRREVKQLREEKEILRKATVFFVRETGR
jgi:transposase